MPLLIAYLVVSDEPVLILIVPPIIGCSLIIFIEYNSLGIYVEGFRVDVAYPNRLTDAVEGLIDY